ncbi:hypothetical protein [Rhodoferax sp. OV413]|uniref:hypothetical protein n=1 Tax=Rhodoferax sp. OV413 TaxID=1855285 RepID=UPI00115FF707|nr:hypothetical protein [Rhodoferax sp. OV413]
MNNIDVSSEFLAVVLYQHDAPRVMKLTAAEAVAPSIRLGEADYLDSGAGDWLGFYDWLRNHQGEVIGVQQWVDETSTFPFSTRFGGVEANVKHGVLRIFFGQSREVDEENSCDQDFGSNRLLVTGESVALTFHAPHLIAER